MIVPPLDKMANERYILVICTKLIFPAIGNKKVAPVKPCNPFTKIRSLLAFTSRRSPLKPVSQRCAKAHVLPLAFIRGNALDLRVDFSQSELTV